RREPLDAQRASVHPQYDVATLDLETRLRLAHDDVRRLHRARDAGFGAGSRDGDVGVDLAGEARFGAEPRLQRREIRKPRDDAPLDGRFAREPPAFLAVDDEAATLALDVADLLA